LSEAFPIPAYVEFRVPPGHSKFLKLTLTSSQDDEAKQRPKLKRRSSAPIVLAPSARPRAPGAPYPPRLRIVLEAMGYKPPKPLRKRSTMPDIMQAGVEGRDKNEGETLEEAKTRLREFGLPRARAV